jgi:hypothetical protein
MKRLLIGLLFAATAVAAPAKIGNASVLGIQLGEKFAVPECSRSKSMRDVEYEYRDTNVCFRLRLDPFRKFVLPNVPIVNDQTIKLIFPQATEMTLDVTAEIVDGNVEGIVIGTSGLSTQDEVLAALRAKYGDPSDFQDQREQNAMGAVFDSHTAVWDFDNLRVMFIGTAGRTDKGSISVETNKEIQLVRAWREQMKAAEPKL